MSVWQNWDMVITVGGIDVSDDLVGNVSIDIERNAARVAEFTLLLSGTIDILSYAAQSVTIDYIDGNAVTWRRFTGVIAEPILDIARSTLKCTCSDDLQNVANGMSNSALQIATGGKWSKYVFNEDVSGFERLQDLLSTVAKSAELDENGTLQINPWENVAVADVTLTTADIVDESLSVELVRRSQLVNRVDVTFSYRFERLYHRVDPVSWTWPLTFCESYFYGTKPLSRAMTNEAINSAGRQILSSTFDPWWSTGGYDCTAFGAPAVGYFNLTPDASIKGFDIDAAYRWQQSVTQSFEISIQATDSIAAYGAITHTLQTAGSAINSVENWTDNNADWSVLPSGFSYGIDADQYRDEIDSAERNNAIDTLIAQAIEKINSSHRSNKVSFSLPLNPALSLSNTIAVSDSNVSAKGVINSIKELYEFDTARVISTVELAISSGQSGLDLVSNSYTVPTPTLPSAEPSFDRTITVPNFIGGSWGNVAYNPATDWGWFVNRSTPELIADVPPDPEIYYDEKLEIRLPAVDDSKTQNQTETNTATITIDVPHNTLVITA